MSTALQYARSPTTGPLRSIDAYVLPHIVEVSAGVHAVIRSILVAPHDVVQRGQEIAVVEPVLEAHRDRRISVKAPASGLVMRSWAMTGDVVAGSWPILSMASNEDVLIVALFPLAGAVRIRRSGLAMVFPTAGTTREASAARIVGVAGSADAGEPESVTETPSARVVLALQDAPASTMWPGTRVVVEIG